MADVTIGAMFDGRAHDPREWLKAADDAVAWFPLDRNLSKIRIILRRQHGKD